MQQAFPEACGMWYDNTLLHEAIVEALKREMDDTETDPDGQSWTDYFIYELDYGRKNDDLKAYRSDGCEIPLSTPADLYRYLGCEIPLSTPADLYRYLAAEKARREKEGFIDRHKAQGDLSEVVERFNEM